MYIDYKTFHLESWRSLFSLYRRNCLRLVKTEGFCLYYTVHDVTVVLILCVKPTPDMFLMYENTFGQIGSIGYPEELEEVHETEVMALVEDVVSCQTITQCC